MALLSLAVQYGTPVDLPRPPKGFTETPERIGSAVTTLAGLRLRQTRAVKKTWVMSYRWLTDTQYTALLRFVDGTLGLGPFELRRQGDSLVYLVNVEISNAVVPLVGSRHCDMTLIQV